jgi:hypothetical protein
VRQSLDRHVSVELSISSAIHLAYASSPKQAPNFIVSEVCAFDELQDGRRLQKIRATLVIGGD